MAELALYPLGSILPYAGEFNPVVSDRLSAQGFVPCDGRALDSSPSSPYYNLFQVIRYSFGGDDYNFFVPDLRGRFLRGLDEGAGRDPNAAVRTAPCPGKPHEGNNGDKVGSLQADTFQSHTHTYSMKKDYHKCNYGSLSSSIYEELTAPTIKDSSSTGGSETRPSNMYANFMIAYK
jgi:microcystin-dependent protein